MFNLSPRVSLLLGLLLVVPRGAQASGLVSHDDGSPVIPVHRMPLINEDGGRIAPAYRQSLPFSTRKTCGVCHDYEKIRGGWHFNAAAGVVPAGRAGEPWVWLDQYTGQQLPLSSRGWEGCRTPESLGITDWEFVRMFGRHMPKLALPALNARQPFHCSDIIEIKAGRLPLACFQNTSFN